jgi:hypothetical protein
VEHKETLETGTVVSDLSDSVETEIDDFFSDGIMSSGEIVGGIFFSGNELFGMEQLSVSSGSDLIDNGGFQIQEDSSGNVLSGSGFGEESVEGIITTSDGLIRGHLAIRLDSVFQTIKFPTGVTYLDTSLTYVD